LPPQVAASVLKPPGSRSFALVSKKPSAERTFAECYLNDPATYPIIIIISGTSVVAMWWTLAPRPKSTPRRLLS